MFYCLMVLCIFVGWDNVVGIATRYGLESRVSNPSGGGKIDRTRPDRLWGTLSLLYNEYMVSFLGVKRSGRGADHLPHLGPRLKKE